MNTPLFKETEQMAWISVGIWIFSIYAAIPFTRTLAKFVDQTWGEQWFGYATIAILVTLTSIGLIHLKSRKKINKTQYIWLIGSGGVFIGYSLFLMKRYPIEAVHFIQYGILGGLLFRALSHRIKNNSVYIIAAIIAGVVGTVDEAIQWIVPQRYWGMNDIWLNVFASALSLTTIAKGLAPSSVQGRPQSKNIQLLCRLAMVWVLIFCTTLLNTPAVILWSAEHIPFMGFLKQNPVPMVEYGYLHHDPAIGKFRSRFTLEQLAEKNRRCDPEIIAILNRYKKDTPDRVFQKTYTPVTAPYIVELKGHLYLRDLYLNAADRIDQGNENHAVFLTIAYGEHRILERYFSCTYQSPQSTLKPEQIKRMESKRLADQIFESKARLSLITRFKPSHVASSGVVLLIILAAIDWLISRQGQKMATPKAGLQ